MVFVPLITEIVNFFVDRWVREMKLETTVRYYTSVNLMGMRTSFGAILTMSPSIPLQISTRHLFICDCQPRTILFMKLEAQVRQVDTLPDFHVSQPKFCACRTRRTGNPRKGVEIEVICDAKYSCNDGPANE